jgi:hypothetical protein
MQVMEGIKQAAKQPMVQLVDQLMEQPVEQAMEQQVEQPVQQQEQQEILHLQDEIHIRIMVILIIIQGRVGDNDAFKSYSMKSQLKV